MNQVVHRRVVSPTGAVTIRGPLVQDVIADAVRIATGRRHPAEDVPGLWRALEGQGWRIEDAPDLDRRCACGERAPFGFTRPDGEAVWTCMAHRARGEAHLGGSEERGARREPEPPRQGALAL